MDSNSSRPKPRTRSKSISVRSRKSLNSPDSETMINLNGEKDNGSASGGSTASFFKEDIGSDIGEQMVDAKSDKIMKGRKRKASEMKSTNNAAVELSAKEKPSVEGAENTDNGSSGSGKRGGNKMSDKEIKQELINEEQSNLKTEDKDDSSANDSSSELKIPDKQALGKGKRARIPNKRYSDFPLRAVSRMSMSAELMDVDNPKSNVENGEMKENAESSSHSDLIIDCGSAYSSPNMTSKARASQINSPVTPAAKKSKPSNIDLNNPNYLKPFQYGWKRELVYRATCDANSGKRNGDIYYYTPTGRKVRSMREVSENLKNKELTLDDFTFFKEPLGLDDPEKEIIRDAKLKSTIGTPAKKATPKIVKTPKNSPKVIVPLATNDESPAVDNKGKSSPRHFKVKLPRSTQQNKAKAEKKTAKAKSKEEDLEVGTYPPNWTSPSTKKTPAKGANSLSDVDKPCRPCSIRCQGVSGLIPTLQCRICLCLYHNECVGLPPHSAVHGYVCKNCQLDQDQNMSCATTTVAPPPPLTPINTLKSVIAQSTVLPKLQRIPRPAEQSTVTTSSQSEKINNETTTVTSKLPRLTPRPPVAPTFVNVSETSNVTVPYHQSVQNENKSIVGSVTTWFPSSSMIQVSQEVDRLNIPDNTQSLLLSRPQHVEVLGNKKFIIIPKHNLVSISPTIAAAAVHSNNNKSVNNSTSGSTSMLGFNFANKVAAEGATNITSALDSASLGPSVVGGNDSEIPKIKIESHTPEHQQNPSSDPKTFPNNNNKDPQDKEENMETDNMKDVEEDDTTCNVVKQTKDDDDDNGGGDSDQEGTPTPKKSSKRLAMAKAAILPTPASAEESSFMDTYLQNVAYGYNTLLYVFQYLKMQDLLHASCVCSMWRDIASHPMLWKTVRMKNSQIHSFEGLADALQKHGTTHLDLRKMLLPSNCSDDIWVEFSSVIKKVQSLRKIELCRCTAAVVQELALSNPKLEVVNAVTIKCETMNLAPLKHLKDLQELRLKSITGFSLTSDLTALAHLKQLKHLSLTSVKELDKLNIEVIADLTNLESLDLGECADFPISFGGKILKKLHKLEKLRLEKGQGECYTFEILEAVKSMPHLEQLELVNFDIKIGFDRALGACTNIKKLLIIPTYISQSATTNHMVLGGVLRLQTTLSHFVWGVTLELLRVTELFVDQCEDPEKKDLKEKERDKERERKDRRPIGNGDSIPVLKPVPLLRNGADLDIPPAQDPPQVEILPLPNLQKLLLQSLPTTRVKILKIPFHATWRQSITDTVN